MRIDDGGPAFPHTYANGEYVNDGGMSLRDYFAAKAMSGQLAYEGMEGCSSEHIAGMAYELADAMLSARKSEGGAG